ncbi:MAG: hypothetical protein H7X89_05765, partial [Rhizobiales bacterium]|nr:hypothetical protein [Hyphomicrobiales bacterium]
PHNGVKWWQIAQKGRDNVEVRTVGETPFNAADRKHVTAVLNKAWSWNCRINFKQLDKIPYGPGAKHSDFVNEHGGA